MTIKNLQIVNEESLDNTLNKQFEVNKNKSKVLTGYPSIDKPWLKYYEDELDEKDIPNMSIYQFALESNKNNMKNIAIDLRSSVNDFSKGILITYQKFFDRISKSAKSSSHMGIKKNEIVPIILPNIPEARILVYSDSILGATSFPVSPLMPTNQLQQLIDENEIKNLFIFEAFYQKYSKALCKTSLENIVLLDGSESLPKALKIVKSIKDTFNTERRELFKSDKRIIPWNEYDSYNREIKEDIEPFYEDNHIAAIIGTSGTTGMPKGVCLTDKNINTVACSYKNGKLFKGNFMDALIPSIGYGISLLHYQTVDGRYVYLIPELLTTRFPEVLCKLKPDNFPGGPVHYINLANSNEFKNDKLPKFENMISGGATLSKDIEKKLNRVEEGYAETGINEDIIVRQGYGLSENVALGTYSKRGSYKFGSIGIPMAYLTIGIFEPDTDIELKYGQQGEICITGPSVMSGYLNNEEETDKVIKVHSDGKRWIHTKDMGYMDEDGHLFHVDRIKNIFMRTGFNVHPAKIAEFINTIPFVRNSTVLGFDHPEEQCVPIAFIELDEDKIIGKTESEIEKEIMKLCYDNLEETSVPYSIVFVNTLPINVGGKIDQQRIKKESEIDLCEKKLVKRINFNND